MKDKTDAMNRGLSVEDMERGFGDAGTPPSTQAYHKRRMSQGGLADNEALQAFENPGQGGSVPAGGFLRRSNYGDRY